MVGGDDLLRGVPQRGLEDIEGPDAVEGGAQPELRTPEQPRTKEDGAVTVEEKSVLNRTIQGKLTKAQIETFFQKGVDFYKSSNFDAAIESLTIAAENEHRNAQSALIEIYRKKNEPEKAFPYLQILAQKDVQVLIQLAEAYEKGIGVEVDVEKAKELYFEAGDRYEKKGGSVAAKEWSPTNIEKAIDAYQNALRLGYQEARVNLGECYVKLADMYSKSDHRNALTAYTKAAEAGHPGSKAKLAEHYFKLGEAAEINIPANPALIVKALDQYLKALNMGHQGAEEKVEFFIQKVIERYEAAGSKGLDSLDDDLETFQLLKGLYASGILHPEMRRGDCFAKFFVMICTKNTIINRYHREVFALVAEVGELYASDTDLSQKKKADVYFRYNISFLENHPAEVNPRQVTAANARINAFYIEMAQIYENGTHGTEIDRELANDYYMKALELDYALPEAKMAKVLGYFIAEGMKLMNAPFENSLSHLEGKLKASRFFGRVLEYKEKHPDVPVPDLPMGKLYVDIAELFERGIGEKAPDLVEAYAYYEEALNKAGYDVPVSRFADLAFRIGKMYDSGDGVNVNTSEARMWYETSILQGDDRGRFRYGMLHLGAKNPFYDPMIAFANVKMAADLGDSKAIKAMADPEIQAQIKILVDDVIQKFESAERKDYLQALVGNAERIRSLADLYISGLVHPDLDMGQNIEQFYSMMTGNEDIRAQHPDEIARLLFKGIVFYKDSTEASVKESLLITCGEYLKLFDKARQSQSFRDREFVKSVENTTYAELAEMYENGTNGVKVNIDMAYKLYSSAMVGGYEFPEDKVIKTYEYLLKKSETLAKSPRLKDKLKASDYLMYIANYKNKFPDGPIDWPPAGKLFYEIAEAYENEPDNYANIKHAYEYYETAKDWGYAVPESKDIEIYFRLGRVYELGLGIDMDKEQAFGYYQHAMNNGHLEARFKYGVMHIQGDGVVPNQVVGYTNVKIAAEMGQVDAVNWMIEQVETRNDPMAQLTLGDLFRQGVNGPPDIDKAIHFYEMAERQNMAEASFGLGEAYGGLNNFAEAVRHYQLGSERDSVNCHRKLANLFYNGAPGVEVNKHFALQYFERLAFTGDAEAQYMAGLIYYRGEDPIFLGPLYERAVRHFNDAVLQNHKEAEYILASMYLENKGVDANLTAAERQERAVSLLKRASEHGSVEAQKRLRQVLSREQ
ncbi:MAG: sel1 repeat family protein [Alphaproteobacteria bacterium]|nr:sel1 repeat family protein [Alphaproteobacteria bacterium]MBP9877414.1 sel1 repeat family protein [Alphaproteobacteria bacterium]